MSFGREKLEGFSIFSKCALLHLDYLKNCLKWSKGLHLGSPRGLVGLLLAHFEGFCSSLGSHCRTLWTPLAPQNREKVGQRVSPEFHEFPDVFRGAKKVPKGLPKRSQKVAKWAPRLTKMAPKSFFLMLRTTCDTVPLLLQQNSVNTCIFTTLAIWFRLLFTQWRFNS